MKALTIRQPWASLIAVGAKSIETRSWPTKYRGELLIHAGLVRPERGEDAPKWVGPYMTGEWTDDIRHVDPCDCDLDEETMGERCMANSDPVPALFTDGGGFAPSLFTKLPLGAVVASCRLADCVPILGAFGGVDADEGHVVRRTSDISLVDVWCGVNS